MREFYFEGLGYFATDNDGRGLWTIENDPDGRTSYGRLLWPHEFSVAGLSKRNAARKIRYRLSEEYKTHEERCVAAYVAEGLGEN